MIIDWDDTLRLTGNDPEVAREMITHLINSLPEEAAQIKSLYAAQNIPELIHRVHKLHGALCYCRLPRLKRLISSLESDLKNHIMESSLLPSIRHHIDQLDEEVNVLAAAMAAEPPQLNRVDAPKGSTSNDKNG